MIQDSRLDESWQYKLVDSIANEIEKNMNKLYAADKSKSSDSASNDLLGDKETLYKIARECGVSVENVSIQLDLQRDQIDDLEKKLMDSNRSVIDKIERIEKLMREERRPKKMYEMRICAPYFMSHVSPCFKLYFLATLHSVLHRLLQTSSCGL